MAKYAYPAIFTPEDDGSFSINFPDLEGCYTCGDSLEDGIEMAEDALALVLYGYEKDGRKSLLLLFHQKLHFLITTLLIILLAIQWLIVRCITTKLSKKLLPFQNG